MVDFHAHILPRLDDGSSSRKESLDMLRKEREHGVDTVIATPHFYADRDNPESFLKERERAYKKLLLEMKNFESEKFQKIVLGAEVAYFEGMSDTEELSQLNIEGTKLLLLEMPAIKWNERMIAEVVAIYEKTGLVPVIAHIDRYIKVFNNRHMADWFEDLPVLIQANASFFTGWKYTRMALKMFDRGQIHLLGTDCHNTNSRPPEMNIATEALKKKFGDGVIAHLEYNEKKAFSDSRREILSILQH